MGKSDGYELHYCPGAISFCVHWALREAGVEVRLRLVDLSVGEQKTQAYRQENPVGQVPMLSWAGQCYYESTALLLLLSDLHPAELNTPVVASLERARWIEHMVRLGNGMLPTLGTWLYAEKNVGVEGRDAIRRYAADKLSTHWQEIDQHLAQREFFAGTAFTAVDCLAAMLMFWVRDMDAPAHRWPHVRRYMQRMRTRAPFRQVCEIEGLQALLEMPLAD